MSNNITMTKEHPQEYLVLGLLMREPRHGYEIDQYFASELARAWHAGRSQIYALLKRLEATGKVTSSVEMQDNRPAKKVYSITAEGRKSFLAWVTRPVQHIRDLRLEFLSKLFFIKDLHLPGVNELLNKQVNVCNYKLLEFKKIGGTDGDEFSELILQFKISQIKAILKWLHACRTHFSLEEGAQR